jgi:hypothetical protein
LLTWKDAPFVPRVPRLALNLAAAIAVAAALLVVAGHVFPNYDAFYALLWGRDIANGRVPDYYEPYAPAAHPLINLLAALVQPLGEGAAVEIFRLLGPLAVGGLCVGLFRLGETLFGWQVGLVAAAVLATRVPTLVGGARGYVDVPTATLIIWAAALEARQPRRGAPVLVLLSLAGLLRPEAWLLSILYAAWVMSDRSRTDRAWIVVLALSGPVLWILGTLAATGTLLGPSHGTAITIAEKPTPFAPTGLLAVPEALARNLGNFMAPIPLALAAAGILIGVLSAHRRRLLLPGGIAVANAVAFAGVGLVGLPLVQRYLFVTAAMLSLFAALAVAATGQVRNPVARRASMLGAAAVLLASVVISDAGRIDDARSQLAADRAVEDDLHALVETPAARRILGRSPVVGLQNPRTLPLLAYWTGKPASAFSIGTAPLIVARSPAAEIYLVGRSGVTLQPSEESDIRNASWALYGPEG